MIDNAQLQQLAQDAEQRLKLSTDAAPSPIQDTINEVSQATARLEEERRVTRVALQEPYTL